MIPMTPVSMIAIPSGSKLAVVIGAVLLLAVIHSKQKQAKPTTPSR
jgi:hypothetical protein